MTTQDLNNTRDDFSKLRNIQDQKADNIEKKLLAMPLILQ
jgi:hypothetical protein